MQETKVSPYAFDEFTEDGGYLEDIFHSWYNDETGTFVMPVEWNELFEKYGCNQFLGRLNQWITDHDIPFPGRGTSRDKALDDIAKLASLNASPLIMKGQDWSHVVDYSPVYPLSDLLISQSQVGNMFAKSHNTHYRLTTPGKEGKSAHDVWEDVSFRRRGLQMIKSQYRPGCELIGTPSEISGPQKPRGIGAIEFAQFFINKGCSATNFRPATAKAIYQFTDARVVYDFSSGWGDRMTAAMCTPMVEHYIATDPNTDLVPMYDAMKSDIYSVLGEENVAQTHMFQLPAEEFRPSDEFGPEMADLVFTSCPYFNLERYGENSTDVNQRDYQCWYRYQTLEDWLHGFLFPSLQNSMDFLRPGGWMVINMADFFEAGQRVPICDSMNDFLAENGMEFTTVMGMHLVKRYGSAKAAGKTNKATKHGEPIWCWRKPYSTY